METHIHTPKDLFQKAVSYTIPEFQRPYVWSQEDQWEPLWEDVRNVAENYLEKLEQSGGEYLEAEENTVSHFLGAVVLQQVPRPAKFIPEREIIDGQQRVTTIQLLLDAIQLVCEQLDFKPAATRLSTLVLNSKDSIGDESDKILKLQPSRTDREAFKHAMDNGLAVDNYEESLIVQAHDFFQEQVRKWIKDVPGSESNRVDALETVVTTMLQMVVIDLRSRDDPNVIFETLNARGTPLEQSDLIKNFVLSRVQKGDEGNIWKGLDEEWWRAEVTQGRLHRPRLDMLLNYWLVMRTGTEVGPARVFDTFRTFTSEQQIRDVMRIVRCDLLHYRRFVTERTPEEDLFYYRTFEVMKAGAITPIVLLLLSVEHDVRIRAFRALESFLIRRMICRQTTKDYNRLLLDLATKLQDGGLNDADKVVSGFLREQTAYSREWPNDETVAASLENSPLYRLLTRGRLRLLLEGVESQLRSSKSEPLVIPTRLTIEHLMPVSWEANWPLPGGDSDEESRENRNRMVHTIGNLTLVTQKLNSAMSNAPWESKQAELYKYGKMSLSSILVTGPQWDEDTILARSRNMAELVAQCWPGPDSSDWGL